MRPGKSSGSYEENWLWDKTNFSNRIGNFTSTEPTMFWILKSLNFAGKPSFWITRAYFRAANREACSDLAPKIKFRRVLFWMVRKWRYWDNKNGNQVSTYFAVNRMTAKKSACQRKKAGDSENKFLTAKKSFWWRDQIHCRLIFAVITFFRCHDLFFAVTF